MFHCFPWLYISESSFFFIKKWLQYIKDCTRCHPRVPVQFLAKGNRVWVGLSGALVDDTMSGRLVTRVHINPIPPVTLTRLQGLVSTPHLRLWMKGSNAGADTGFQKGGVRVTVNF